MFKTTKGIFSNKSIRSKLLFTLVALVVYNFALYLQVPMVFKELLPISGEHQSWFPEGSIFDFLNAFTGGALQSLSFVALGVGPYITSSIIIQLLQMDVVPALKNWSEEGESGKAKINQTTRYIAISLAFIQALGMTIAFSDGLFDLGTGQATAMTFLYLAILITAGTSFLLWLGDQITKKGIGNGVSMIIVSGIIISFPTMIFDLYQQFVVYRVDYIDIIKFIGVMAMFIAVIVGVVFVQESSRKIPVQYSNRTVSSKDSNIPIKLNAAGVIPVIFAVTILSIPTIIFQLTDAIGWTSEFVDGATPTNFFLVEVFDIQRPIGFIVYVLFIFVFSTFYAFLQVNPEKISDNLQKQNAFIPGVRPGEDTASFIASVLFKISLIGALFLVVIASLPLVATMVFNLPASVQIGGTSLLIVVGVAMETARQIETELNEKTYKGFIR